MRRKSRNVAAAFVAISLGFSVGLSSSAWASAHKAKKSSTITCSELSGTLTGTTQLADCKGGNTGGGSTNLGASLANGGTITWLSGSKTTVGSPTLSSVSTKKCPVISGTSATTANKVSATVTADTGDNITVPGTFTGTACLYGNDDVATVKPGFKIS